MTDDDIIDAERLDELTQQALAAGQQWTSNGRPVLSDWVDVAHVTNWVKVFACPRLFEQLHRMPPREHLLRLLDIYDAYLQHDGRYSNADFQPVIYERRGTLAARFRALVEQWTPLELPAEMIQTARELLHAEGENPPPSGWDEYAAKEEPYPVEDCLLWPEGVPAILKAKANPHACDADEHIEAPSAPWLSSEEHGHLPISPQPTPRQILVTLKLLEQLVGPFHHAQGGPGGWWILPAPEVHLAPDALVFPRLAGWRRERMPSLPQDTCIRLSPDWVCEVLLSPSEDRDRDRLQKMLLYERHGVKWMWMMDLPGNLFEIYVLRKGGRWVRTGVYQGATQVRAAPFDAIELDLSLLWAE